MQKEAVIHIHVSLDLLMVNYLIKPLTLGDSRCQGSILSLEKNTFLRKKECWTLVHEIVSNRKPLLVATSREDQAHAEKV